MPLFLKNKIPKNKNKYRAIKIVDDGKKFDSKMEHSFYILLKKKQALGKLKIIKLQEKIKLSEAKIGYIPDYTIEINGHRVYIDVKGVETPVFRIKSKLWQAYGPGPLYIVKKRGNNFYIDAEYTPKGFEIVASECGIVQLLQTS
jgi:predicted nuclease of restriction endonuclease-like RecB superfamily